MAEYLEHYGVKGMRWGHRKDRQKKDAGRKKQAKKYQQTLWTLDDQLKGQTIALNNAKASSNYHAYRAKKAQAKGLSDEAQHFSGLSKAYMKKANQISKDSIATGKKMVDTIAELEKNGYSWKVTPTNFSSSANVYGYEKKINEEHGLSKSTSMNPNAIGGTNASSGNRFAVKDSNAISERKKEKYKDTHYKMQGYRPQKVYYVPV